MKLRTIYRESTVEQMKPRIKSMIWNIRKQKTRRKDGGEIGGSRVHFCWELPCQVSEAVTHHG